MLAVSPYSSYFIDCYPLFCSLAIFSLSAASTYSLIDKSLALEISCNSSSMLLGKSNVVRRYPLKSVHSPSSITTSPNTRNFLIIFSVRVSGTGIGSSICSAFNRHSDVHLLLTDTDVLNSPYLVNKIEEIK